MNCLSFANACTVGAAHTHSTFQSFVNRHSSSELWAASSVLLLEHHRDVVHLLHDVSITLDTVAETLLLRGIQLVVSEVSEAVGGAGLDEGQDCLLLHSHCDVVHDDLFCLSI